MSGGTLKLCQASVTLPPAAGIGLFSLVTEGFCSEKISPRWLFVFYFG